MIVHTSRLFDQRADELGPLDVTRKSGKEGLIWAPSWERVLRWEYPALDLEREHLTLQCYCVDHNYCHRTLLARDILPGACARLGIEYEFHGEL